MRAAGSTGAGCAGCRYWRGIAAHAPGGLMACHYLLDTGRMRGGAVSECDKREKPPAGP